MKLLGLRLCEHDTNFCLYNDGVVKYHKTERLNGIKHHAIDNLWEWEFVLKDIFNISVEELDEICIVFDPWRYGYGNVTPVFPAQIANILPNAKCPVWWLNHHLAHKLSYDPLLTSESDVSIVIDGWGDNDVAWTVFKDNRILDTGSVGKDGSIGWEYSQMARDLSIDGHYLDVAGKLMGLQSYGNIDVLFYDANKNKNLLDMVSEDSWYSHNKSSHVAQNRLLDWARTTHELMFEYIFSLFSKYAKQEDQISYIGGVAQNVCWNTNLKRYFKNLQIFPHCADDGLSIGALKFLTNKRNLDFKLYNFPFSQSDELPNTTPNENTIDRVSQFLSDGKIVGWYQGHGEIGPRALGNRSILMHPNILGGKDYINSKVKHRENYRPFGATILKEHSNKYFYNKFENPYMLYTDNFLSVDNEFESIRHIDNTCRTQTLGDENPVYRKLLESFYEKTGIPMLLNTSLNRGGKPICGSIKDAFGVYYETELDVLVIGNEVYTK